MVIEYIRYETADAAALVKAYEAAARALDASPHCLAYELARCSEDERAFILRIEWDSLEGHLAGFRKSKEFAAFFATVRPFVGEIREMRHYQLTAVASRRAS